MSGMHVIIVKLKIKPEFIAVFEDALKRHVAMTRKTEPGCVQFDVSMSKDEPRTYLIYEVYADDAAMAAHVKSPTLAEIQNLIATGSESRTRFNATRWS